MVNGYANAEEAEQAACSAHREDRRYDDHNCRCDGHDHRDDHDRRHDDHDVRRDDRLESLRSGQSRHRRPDISINIIDTYVKRTYDMDFGKLLDGPCPIHKDAKHTMQECRGLKTALEGKLWQNRLK